MFVLLKKRDVQPAPQTNKVDKFVCEEPCVAVKKMRFNKHDKQKRWLKLLRIKKSAESVTFVADMGILVEFSMSESTISRKLGMKTNFILSQEAIVRYVLQNQICIPNVKRLTLLKSLCAT